MFGILRAPNYILWLMDHKMGIPSLSERKKRNKIGL